MDGLVLVSCHYLSSFYFRHQSNNIQNQSKQETIMEGRTVSQVCTIILISTPFPRLSHCISGLEVQLRERKMVCFPSIVSSSELPRQSAATQQTDSPEVCVCFSPVFLLFISSASPLPLVSEPYPIFLLSSLLCFPALLSSVSRIPFPLFMPPLFLEPTSHPPPHHSLCQQGPLHLHHLSIFFPVLIICTIFFGSLLF